MWENCLYVSIIILGLSTLLAALKLGAKYKSGRFLTPSKIMFAGVILSSLALFIPIYSTTLKESDCGGLETFLISVHNVIRLFVVDGEFSFITSNIKDVSEAVYNGYTVMFAILFVLAPFLTFEFVLSFFKNFSSYRRYLFHFGTDVYIFSELNDKSLALATSLSEKKGRLFVFTDVFEREEEQNYELVEKAKELGAICFKKDVLTINFAVHSKSSALNFFTIGENHSENISQSLKLIEKLKYRKNTNLYVFSTQVEAEILLANAFEDDSANAEEKGKKNKPIAIKVRRVNEVQSLINRNLYENGFEKIFCSAHEDENGVKQINAVVIGMGQHGSDMTKALAWFCQMDGYEITINSFDKDKLAGEKFLSQCPELMEFSGKTDIPGETRYSITVHSDIDVDTATFDKNIESLPRTTYVFVALGNDEKNISTSVKLRAIFERMDHHPVIQTIVYNSEKKEALVGIKNFKGMEYKIDFIGDMKSSYSEDVILDSDVEEEALKRHLKWGDEREFWRYDYNYKSSIASAIHRKMKILCGIPGIEKEPKDREEGELRALRVLEHRRWNAYMRSEGYVYGGTIERSGRNDLAKMHNCLVPFDRLPLKEQEKDDD